MVSKTLGASLRLLMPALSKKPMALNSELCFSLSELYLGVASINMTLPTILLSLLILISKPHSSLASLRAAWNGFSLFFIVPPMKVHLSFLKSLCLLSPSNIWRLCAKSITTFFILSSASRIGCNLLSNMVSCKIKISIE